MSDLLKELSASMYGFHIEELPLSASTQSGDIVVLSVSRKDLQELLNIRRNYANTWRSGRRS